MTPHISVSTAALLLLATLQLCRGQYYDSEDEKLVQSLHKRYQGGGNGPGLTPQQQKKVVDMHNKLRKGEAGSDMQKLVWNNRLATLAQSWADRCVYEHRQGADPNFNPKDYGFNYVGENIWAWSADVNPIPDSPINDWFAEKANYNYDTGSCTGVCGHYTAIVWAKTTDVGCGFAKCPFLAKAGYTNGVFMVCNYGPGGNAQDEKPFKRGKVCTECPSGQGYCTYGLCDRSCTAPGAGGVCECRAKCRNGGTQTSDCRCQCKGQYIGPSCSDLCQDTDRRCGLTDGTGWPEFMCNIPDFGETVREKCPKLCKMCGPKRLHWILSEEQNV